MNINTPTQLMELLTRLNAPQVDVPLTDLKYVIYVRKSTKGEDKQERSIADQISECKAFADKQNLMVRSIVQEQESAKDSGQRPLFNQMITDIRNRKYDGIIAWHPDRIARNMKEAGEVIDMLDKKELKDLKFPSFSFTNDQDGKMLLGISFVLAKLYSEKLGKDITRGVGKSVLEGQLPGQTKYGYYKDKITNMLYPDGDNFKLIKKTWEMKVAGDTNLKIANYINKVGFAKALKRGQEAHRQFKMTENKLSIMFRNPIYAGIHKHGDNWVNLIEKCDFTPMVTVENYIKVNTSWITENRKETLRRVHQGAIIGSYLKGVVRCNDCGKYLMPAPTTKKLANGNRQIIIYLRCKTDGCSKKESSARAQVVDKYVQKFLASSDWMYSKTAYKQFKSDMTVFVKAKNKELTEERTTLLKKKAIINNRVESSKDAYRIEQDAKLKESFKEDWVSATESLDLAVEEIKSITNKIEQNQKAILGFDEFCELFKKLPALSKKVQKLQHKDKLTKILFANLTVEIKKGDSLNSEIVGFELNSPFKELYNTHGISLGGAGGN